VILVLDYGFTVLGLRSIVLSAISYSERPIRAYKRAGFREPGRRRECVRRGARRYHDIYVECLATEFSSPLPAVAPAEALANK
jgi:RimJ/RimL family protein N-acetyltransferase